MAHQVSIQWQMGILFLCVKQLKCEADHSSQPTADVMNRCSYTSIAPVCLHGMDRAFHFFTFYLKLEQSN